MAVLAPDATREEQLQLAADYKTGHSAHREDGVKVAEAALYDGALDCVLGFDEAGFLLSAATGKSRRGLDRFLLHHGLGMFQGTQTADDAPSKPHPQMVLNCLAAADVSAGSAVMIGDTEYDMAMGRAAGVHTIGVSWGYHPVDRVRRGGAEQIAETFEELSQMVGSLWGRP
jgi:phosphoglycolate phosphatase